MPTLRDHTKNALSASEPSDAEAKEDLDRVLRRARRERPARLWRLAVVPAVAAAAVALWLAVGRKTEPVARTAPPPPPGGIHLYLRASGEPEDRAMTLDLDTQGAP